MIWPSSALRNDDHYWLHFCMLFHLSYPPIYGHSFGLGMYVTYSKMRAQLDAKTEETLYKQVGRLLLPYEEGQFSAELAAAKALV
jgi:hypothetical protein